MHAIKISAFILILMSASAQIVMGASVEGVAVNPDSVAQIQSLIKDVEDYHKYYSSEIPYEDKPFGVSTLTLDKLLAPSQKTAGGLKFGVGGWFGLRGPGPDIGPGIYYVPAKHGGPLQTSLEILKDNTNVQLAIQPLTQARAWISKDLRQINLRKNDEKSIKAITEYEALIKKIDDLIENLKNAPIAQD